MTNIGTSRRFRSLIVWSARLVLLAYVFQLSAFDHHVDISNVSGVSDSQVHVLHCHGSTSSCADGTGVVTALPSATLTVLPPSSLSLSLETPSPVLEQPSLSPIKEPPRRLT